MMLNCLWTVSGPLLWGCKVQVDDGADDDGDQAEVDRKRVLHRPRSRWCQVGTVLKG